MYNSVNPFLKLEFVLLNEELRDFTNLRDQSRIRRNASTFNCSNTERKNKFRRGNVYLLTTGLMPNLHTEVPLMY